jgi:hypothetical protein
MFCIQLGMRLCEFRMRRLECRMIPLQRLNLIVELYEKRLNLGERTTTCDEGVDSIDQFSERVHSDDQITPDAELPEPSGSNTRFDPSSLAFSFI